MATSPQQLWDQFCYKLRGVGTSVDDIKCCSESVRNELMRDLGFTPLQCAVLQTEWSTRLLLQSSEPIATSLTSEHPVVGTPSLMPIPYHSKQFAEVAQKITAMFSGTSAAAAAWRVVAIDHVPANLGTAADNGAELSGGSVQFGGGDPVVPVATRVESTWDVPSLVAQTAMFQTPCTLTTRWEAHAHQSEVEVLVGVLTPGSTWSVLPDEVQLQCADGSFVGIDEVHTSKVQREGYDTLAIFDNDNNLSTYKITRATQLRVQYVATVVCVRTGNGGASDTNSRSFKSTGVVCEVHNDHEVEFWNPATCRLTCSLCHLKGDAQMQPCLTIAEAAALSDSAAPVWREKALAQLTEIRAAAAIVDDALEKNEVNEARDRAQVDELVATLKKQLMDRRDELIERMGTTYTESRNKLVAAQQLLRSLTNSLERQVDKGEQPMTPVDAMLYRTEVARLIGTPVPQPTCAVGCVHFRPVAWDAHMLFQAEVGVVELPVQTVAEQQKGPDVVDLSGAVGLVEHLATAGGTAPYRNPHVAGDIKLSSSVPFVIGALEDLAADGEPHECRTKSERNGWISVDLSQHRRLRCNRYALRHGHAGAHAALRDWVFEGSDDGATWKLLDSHHRDASLGGAAFGQVSFKLEEPSSPYRYFRVRITGPNAAGHGLYHIELSAVELYGTLYCD
eukprot:PhM_4_TR4246/c1_g2_i1/m.10010